MHTKKKIATMPRLFGALLAASAQLFLFDQVGAQDLRGVSWGDSVEAVRASEKTLKFDVPAPSSFGGSTVMLSLEDEQIGVEKAKMFYVFFQNRLVEAVFNFELGEARNPLAQDNSLYLLLKEKYGESKCLSIKDMREHSWELPRTSIKLVAGIYKSEKSNKDYSHLTLSYEAKNADAVELKKRRDEWLKREREQTGKDKQKL